jgi:hypothetical protein
MDRQCGIETRSDGVRICSVHKTRLKQRTAKQVSAEDAGIFSALYCPESKRTVTLPSPSL